MVFKKFVKKWSESQLLIDGVVEIKNFKKNRNTKVNPNILNSNIDYIRRALKIVTINYFYFLCVN